ncbi:potassium-transporting ATPase subunit F [Terribacillus saccharophilus]
MIIHVGLLTAGVAVIGYLVYALLYPEKF